MNKAINLLGWVGTAAVVIALGLRFQTFKPEWIQYSWYAAMAGLVLVLLYMASQWREVPQTFSHRQTRLGTIAATSVVLVLGILVALNYLASRRNHRWDLTAGKQFSVADQTRNILQKLDAPVKVLVFDKASNFDTFRDRLDEYRVPVEPEAHRGVHRSREGPGPGQPAQGAVVRHGRLHLQGPDRDRGRAPTSSSSRIRSSRC